MAVSNFIQSIWSKKIQDDLEIKCKLVDNCLRDYEGDIKHAGSVKILGVGEPTIGAYDGSQDISIEEMSDKGQVLNIDQANYFAFYVDDINKAQSVPGLMEKYQQKQAVMTAAAAFINAKYGAGTAQLTIRESYLNMREKIEPCMYIVERAMKAMEAAGMCPKTVPVRGGTDGARLSYMGLPCPNLCTGGDNFHGRYEYIVVEDMERCVDMLVNILTSF